MVRKPPCSRRTANVAVSLDPRLVLEHLFHGVNGSTKGELIAAISAGVAPFARDIDPSTYSCADSFRRDYLNSLILSKFDDGKSSDKKQETALGKFFEAEERCRQVNAFFLSPVGGWLTSQITVEAAIYTARRKITGLLGELDLNEVALGFGFGPGATTRLGRKESDTWYKFRGKPEVTPNCTVFADAVFQHSPLWKLGVVPNSETSELPYTVVKANRVVTVPKDAEKDRCIAIEPDLNMFVQKGFGVVIRNRLKRVGIDLNDQVRNQVLAHEGSVTGKLATIDLSMASDTLAHSVVDLLLPPDWLMALEQCRSPEGVLPSGEIIRYQKFSSMGNGYTFELESLIFWALAEAISELSDEMDRRVVVYGDDIIVPTAIAEPVIGLLQYCGFKTNRKKTFVSGPFRESCGKHYFQGVDVTPFYVRKCPKLLSDWFLLYNNIVRWALADKWYRDAGFEDGVRASCSLIRSKVPEHWRKPRIPLGVGDGAFVGSFDECVPKLAGRGFNGYKVQVLLDHKPEVLRGGHSRLLKELFKLERSQPGWLRGTGGVHLTPSSRDELLGFAERQLLGKMSGIAVSKRAKVRKTLVRQWADLGPWI